MPRFLVERDFEMVSEEEIMEGVARSRSTMREHFPDLDWKHTHVCHTPGGEIKAFCVYSAPSAERLAEHTASVGGYTAHRIHEILAVMAREDT